IAFSRFTDPGRRIRLIGPLAMMACAVLTLFAVQPGLIAALVILTVSGACCCYQVAASAAFVTAAPPQRRSQAFGIAQGGISLAQGVAMVAAGAAARYASPSSVIAVSGAIGVVIAAFIAAGGARTLRNQTEDTAGR